MALRTNLLQVASLRNSIQTNDEILGFASDYTTEIRFTFATLKSAILGGSGTGAYLLKDGSEAMSGGLQINPVWNSGPTVFKALKVNVTDTSSDLSSLLLDLQKDSTPVFQVVKSGQIKVNNANALLQASNILTLGNSSNTSVQTWGNLNLTSVWNNGATTFSGIDQQITDTASASGSKAYRLRVGSVDKAYISKTGAGYFAGDITTGGYVGVGTTLAYLGADGSNIGFTGTQTNHPFQIRTNSGTRVHITTGGYVGVGTETPAQRFTALGNILAEGNDSILLDSVSGKVSISGRTGGWALAYQCKGSEGSDLGGLWAYGINDTLNYLNIGSTYNSAELTVLKSNGYVGVGTNFPSRRLTVFHGGNETALFDSNSTAETQIAISNSSTGGRRYMIISGGQSPTTGIPTGALGIRDYFYGLVRMVISSSGHVGIGVNSPGSRLDVVDTGQAVNTWTSIADCIADASFRFKGSNNANGYGLFMGYASSSNNAQGIQAGNQVGNSSVPLVLNPFGGSLGINKLSPTSQLHLAGDFAIEEKVSAPSSLANNSIIYSIDNGSSKTNLMAQMPSGSAQKILGEPPTLSGNEPGTVYLIGGENFGVDTSGWFSGDVTHYAADLPRGVTINSLTGLISGSITYTPSQTFTVRAYNGIGYLDYSFSFEVIKTLEQMQMQAKAWLDMAPTTLRTDLVAALDSASSQYLRHTNPSISLAGEMTLSFWVKFSTSPSSQVSLFRSGFSGDVNHLWIRVGMNGVIYFRFRSGGTDAEFTSGSNSSGQWMHIMATRDAANVCTGYVNGISVGTISQSGELMGRTIATPILDFGSGSTYTPTAQLAHAALWSTDKTSNLSDLYNGGVLPTVQEMDALDPTGRVSCWPMFEPRGSRYDIWGSNHLTAINNPTAVHGPVEYQAREYAGVTKWINQGLASGKFGDLTANSLWPQLGNDNILFDGIAKALSTITGALSGEFSVICVGRKDAAAPSSAFLMDSDNAARTLFFAPSAGLRAVAGAAQATINNSTSRFVAITSVTQATLTLDALGQVADGAGATAGMAKLYVGGPNNSPSGLEWVGEVESIIIISRLLTAAEKAALKAYFA